MLGSTLARTRCAAAVQTGEVVVPKVPRYLPSLRSGWGRTRRHAHAMVLPFSSDLTSSFRQILHLTVARKSLVNNQLQLVNGHVTASKPDDRPPRRAVRQRVVPARWGSVEALSRCVAMHCFAPTAVTYDAARPSKLEYSHAPLSNPPAPLLPHVHPRVPHDCAPCTRRACNRSYRLCMLREWRSACRSPSSLPVRC